MRTCGRFVVLLALLIFAAGPLLSASSVRVHRLTVGPPAPPASRSSSGLLELLALGALAGTIQVGDLGKISKKWSRNAGNAAGDYKDGVQGAGASWIAGASAGGDNYRTGVTAAINRGAFEKGVAAAGSQKYVDRAVKNGAIRYAPGVQGAEVDWQKGYSPYAAVLNSLNLPPPGPRGAIQNQDRSAQVGIALNKARTGG